MSGIHGASYTPPGWRRRTIKRKSMRLLENRAPSSSDETENETDSAWLEREPIIEVTRMHHCVHVGDWSMIYKFWFMTTSMYMYSYNTKIDYNNHVQLFKIHSFLLLRSSKAWASGLEISVRKTILDTDWLNVFRSTYLSPEARSVVESAYQWTHTKVWLLSLKWWVKMNLIWPKVRRWEKRLT